jgi:hypothetical protein
MLTLIAAGLQGQRVAHAMSEFFRNRPISNLTLKAGQRPKRFERWLLAANLALHVAETGESVLPFHANRMRRALWREMARRAASLSAD